MNVILQQLLRRREEGPKTSLSPEVLRVGVYDHKDESAPRYFELRGEDAEGHVHFSFRDERKMVVLTEFRDTLSDLRRSYDPIDGPETGAGHA